MTTKKGKKRRSSEYKGFLLKQLRDSQAAAEYLTAAFEEGEDVFLLAVKDVVEARGGIGALAKATSLNREGLYAMLSRKGNPRLSSITSILAELGFHVKFLPDPSGKKAA